MKYILDKHFNIFCSENFYIPKFNCLFDFINNDISPYETSNKFDLNKYLFVSEEDVETVRFIYHNYKGSLLDEKNLNWFFKFTPVVDDLDFENPDDIKLSSYYLNLFMELLSFPSNVIKGFNRLYVKEIYNLIKVDDKKQYFLSIVSKFKDFIDTKKFWVIESLDKCVNEYKFIDDLMDEVIESGSVDYDLIESKYYDILDSGVVRFIYEFNNKSNIIAKGLNVDQQYNYLIEFNNFIINNLEDALIKVRKLSANEINIIKSLNNRLERILKLKIKEWE